MEIKLKEFENKINEFNITTINFDSIVKLKQLNDSIINYHNELLWINFNKDIKELSSFNIEINILDKKENPKNILLNIINKVKSNKNINTSKLYNLYFFYEDLHDEYESKLKYLFDMIDEKFNWLDDNEEFIKITDFLDKISEEICDGVIKHINQKKEFYEEYFKTTFIETSIEDSDECIINFVKNYILNNYNIIFNQVCLDVLELNGIKDEEQIKQIITLYYDYTKQITKNKLFN